METLVITKVIPFIATAGTSYIVKITEMTIKSIMNLLSNISNIRKKEYETSVVELEKLDIYNTINIIGELVREQNNNKELPDSVKNGVLSVHDILSKIERELDIIINSITIHEQKYFTKWRTFNCSVNINTIKAHEHILRKRYKLLRDMIIINISNKVK